VALAGPVQIWYVTPITDFRVNTYMRINELFDKSPKMTRVSNVEDEVEYQAWVGDRLLVVTFEDMRGDDMWDATFYTRKEDGRSRFDVTGEGDAIPVMGAVISAMKEFVEDRKPERVDFTADKTEKDRETGRAKLYQRLVSRFASQLGYDLDSYDSPNKVTFSLTRSE